MSSDIPLRKTRWNGFSFSRNDSLRKSWDCDGQFLLFLFSTLFRVCVCVCMRISRKISMRHILNVTLILTIAGIRLVCIYGFWRLKWHAAYTKHTSILNGKKSNLGEPEIIKKCTYTHKHASKNEQSKKQCKWTLESGASQKEDSSKFNCLLILLLESAERKFKKLISIACLVTKSGCRFDMCVFFRTLAAQLSLYE